MAMRIFASIEDAEEGFAIFSDWSAKWPFYDPSQGPFDDRECWDQVCGCPPDRTGIHVLRKMAREAGWVPKLQVVEPTYQINAIELKAAREKLRYAVRHFLRQPPMEDDDPFGPTQAIPVDTGVGKTRITIEELATAIHEEKIKGKVIYAVPQHSLSDEIVERFRKQGINARIYRGYSAPDPSIPGNLNLREDEQIKMCLRANTALALSKKNFSPTMETCCKKGKKVCPLLSHCHHQDQLVDAEDVQVWIIAADMLFYGHEVLKNPARIVIDETMWQKGLRGLENNNQVLIPISSLFGTTGEEEVDRFRHKLGQILNQQDNLGGFETQYLYKHYPDGSRRRILWGDDCRDASRCEWDWYAKLMKDMKQSPDMSDAAIEGLLAKKDILYEIWLTRHLIDIWEEMSRLLGLFSGRGIDVSGRLIITRHEGQRKLQWCRVAKIHRHYWKAPTLIIDATLPEESILKSASSDLRDC